MIAPLTVEVWHRLASTARSTDDVAVVLESESFRVTIDRTGVIGSIADLRHDREMLPPGGSANLLELHPDHPNRWDAWDLDAHYRHTVTPLTHVGERRVEGEAVVVRRSFGASSVEQRIALHADRIEIDTTVDWHERETVLELAVDCDVHATRTPTKDGTASGTPSSRAPTWPTPLVPATA